MVAPTTKAAPKAEFAATEIMPNCTALELSARQWGASYMTYTKPVYAPDNDNQFIPKSYSIYNWGQQPNLPGVIKPLELGAYIETPYYIAWDRDMTSE